MSVTVVAALAAAALAAAGCGSTSSGTGASPGAGTTDAGVRGGTLTVVGSGDVDHFDTAAGYYSADYNLFRAISRQLYQYATTPTTAAAVDPVPDLATTLPTITDGGVTYTIHIRHGAMWDTSPPRQVTADDVVLGFKRLCNPTAPVAAPGYFDQTIRGFQTYCDGFSRVAGTVEAERAYVQTHSISGIRAMDRTTVQFRLVRPASDFVNILALTFSSPAPVEALRYLPASVDLARHWVSDGPYRVHSYTPDKSIVLMRNPTWNPATDPLRKGWVDRIRIEEGAAATPTAAVQQIQAGTADMEWDENVGTAQLAGMVAGHDRNLVIGPQGPATFTNLNPILDINFQSPNNGGALQKLKVRQALEYAINKTADSQLYGGPVISRPLDQLIPGGYVGNITGFDPYPTPGDNGDPAKARALLAQAGYQPGQIRLNLVYRTSTVHPQLAETDQAALQAAGFTVKLMPASPNAFYSSYLQNPTASKAGQWDIAESGWNPDWLGNNGRSVIEPLFDGRTYGPDSSDFGDYNSPAVNRDIDTALSATSSQQSTSLWQSAARQVMDDAAVVPIGAQKLAVYHSSRLQNCLFNIWIFNCDVTNVWIRG